MNIHEQAKIELGRQWLAHISYSTEWSNDEFIAAIKRENMSKEAQEAIAFTLKHHGEQAIAEGDKMANEIADHSVKCLEESAHMTALIMKGLRHELDHLPELLSALEEALPHTSDTFDTRVTSCLESLLSSQKQMLEMANSSPILEALLAKCNPVETIKPQLSAA